MRETDRNFIFSTWKKGLKYGNSVSSQDPKAFDRWSQDLISTTLKQATTTIAALKEDDDVILGYSVVRGDTIDWVFVKNLWRKIGIAKELLKHITPKYVSRVTKPGETLRIKYNLKLKPYP